MFLGFFNVKNVSAETQKLTAEKRRVVYIYSGQAEKKVDLDCNKEEDIRYVNKLVSDVPVLREAVHGNTNCFVVLKYFIDSGLKDFTQANQSGIFSQIGSMSGPSSMTDSEFLILINTRVLDTAKGVFPKKDGWNDPLINAIIVPDKELRKVLGSDCFFCKKDLNE
jgi:hypothetical protein